MCLDGCALGTTLAPCRLGGVRRCNNGRVLLKHMGAKSVGLCTTAAHVSAGGASDVQAWSCVARAYDAQEQAGTLSGDRMIATPNACRGCHAFAGMGMAMVTATMAAVVVVTWEHQCPTTRVTALLLSTTTTSMKTTGRVEVLVITR